MARAPGRAALAGQRHAHARRRRARRCSTSPRATRNGAPLAGLTADARLAHPADERLDRVIAVRTVAAGVFHGAGRGAAGAVGIDRRSLSRRPAGVPLAQPRLVAIARGKESQKKAMSEALDLSLYAKPAGDGTLGMDLAVEGIACGACIAPHRERGEAPAGRDRGAAQFHQSPAARGLDRRRDRAGANPANAGEHRLSRLSVRALARRAGGGGRSAPPHALPGGRRLRRHEHHAAVGVGVVGQCHRHHAGDARFLPLGLGADRAAGGGLCRPAVLCQRLARAA